MFSDKNISNDQGFEKFHQEKQWYVAVILVLGMVVSIFYFFTKFFK